MGLKCQGHLMFWGVHQCNNFENFWEDDRESVRVGWGGGGGLKK